MAGECNGKSPEKHCGKGQMALLTATASDYFHPHVYLVSPDLFSLRFPHKDSYTIQYFCFGDKMLPQL